MFADTYMALNGEKVRAIKLARDARGSSICRFWRTRLSPPHPLYCFPPTPLSWMNHRSPTHKIPASRTSHPALLSSVNSLFLCFVSQERSMFTRESSTSFLTRIYSHTHTHICTHTPKRMHAFFSSHTRAPAFQVLGIFLHAQNDFIKNLGR